MEPLAALLVIVALGVVVLVVSQPLRAGPERGEDAEAGRVRELEAAKEAKYREIRDLELDFRTGKLSEADFRALDGQLRAEAVRILRALDEQR